MTETDIQAGFRNRLRYVGPSVHVVAVVNAGKRSQWAAMQAKREGLAKGFPDVAVYWPGAGHALIEFKTPKGRVSIDQAEWIERLDGMGHRVAVCRSVDEALAFLIACGAPVRGSVAA